MELQTQVDKAIGEPGSFSLQNLLADHDLGERVPQEKFMELLVLSIFLKAFGTRFIHIKTVFGAELLVLRRTSPSRLSCC